MQEKPKHALLKSFALRVAVVPAILFIGIFMYSLLHGGIQVAAMKVRQLAQLASSNIGANKIEVDLMPALYDPVDCSTGVARVPGMIIATKPDVMRVYSTRDGANAELAVLNTQTFFVNGKYKLTATLVGDYAWSARSVFEFTVDKSCPQLSNSSTTTVYAGASSTSPSGQNGGVATTTLTGISPVATSTTTSANGASSNNGAPATTTQSNTPPTVAATDVPFDIAKSYPYDWAISPYLLKDNVRIYTGAGMVTLQVEVPGDKAVILLGSSNGWTAGGVFGPTQGLTRAAGSNRWFVNIDTTKYADGVYRLGSAYFSKDLGWKQTGVMDFTIQNKAALVAVDVTTTTTAATVPVSTVKPGALVAPAPLPLANTVPSQLPALSKENISPTLRLVVADRAITLVGHIFDREQLELRLSSVAVQSVQFFALSMDGALKPAIKELGKGGKDELLSRAGNEVWTYSMDMSLLPTGSYRLFARVHTPSGLIEETAPSSVVVQHLNQFAPSGNTSDGATAIPPATATREQILARVTDPGTCQNRQECQVFCSSNGSSTDKCTDFARVESTSVFAIPGATSDIALLQTEVRDQYNSKLGELLGRFDVTAQSSTTSAGTATSVPVTTGTTTQEVQNATWEILASTGRPSLADVAPKQLLEKIVKNQQALAILLPEDVKTARDLQSYCGVMEHGKQCADMFAKYVPEFSASVKKQEEFVQRAELQVAQIIEQRTGARVFVDSDGDGVSDYDEVNIYHTDPMKRDSYGSGYSDGAALLTQTSSIGQVAGISTTTLEGKASLGQGLVVENPKITGTTQSELLAVVGVVPTEFKENQEGKKDISKVAFRGKALPNSFVKVYLFSDPIVVTVKTDDQGNWTYVLDKTLPNGAHTAFVAMVDGGGRILAKSAPLPFIKEASAISIETANPITGSAEKTGMFGGLTPFAIVTLLLGVLGIGLSVIGAVIGIRNSRIDGGGTGAGIA